MTQPNPENETAFEFEPLFLADEEMRPLFVPLIKATYVIEDANTLIFNPDVQLPVSMAGEHWGDPETTSYKYEPEVAFAKPLTDVVLIADAVSRKGPVTSLDVEFGIGKLKKKVSVFGDRRWQETTFGWKPTKPKSFETMPLIYERAFGGYVPGTFDTEKPLAEPRNVMGVGYKCFKGDSKKSVRVLPNLENPKQLIKMPSDSPDPAGFGFTMPNWKPRVDFAGTYDKAWQKNRMPLLPKDFDRRYFNAAPTDQILPKRLNGDERIRVKNASPMGWLDFNLPGIVPPVCEVKLISGKTEALQTELDTVIVNTLDNVVILLWRQHLVLRTGVDDVVSIKVTSENAPPKPEDD